MRFRHIDRVDQGAFGSGMSLFDRTRSALATAVRGAAGRSVVSTGNRPERRLVLYEMENCPFSRKAREALSMLGLDAEIRPCPEHDRHHRPDLTRLIGDEQIPVLLDPNTGSTIKDSDRIVSYLFSTYGDGRKPPLRLRAGKLTTLSSKLASKIRADRGTQFEPARRPQQPLELWGYEASPETRLIREELSRFALPYVARNVARGSAKLKELERSTKIPMLVDPNTGAKLDGASQARRYLARTYGLEQSKTHSSLPPRPAMAARG
jgi:glutathione S-transferase